MRDPAFGVKVALLVGVLLEKLIPQLADIDMHEQLYYGCHLVSANPSAGYEDFTTGAMVSLYTHVIGRACSSTSGCFHWSNLKTTLGCRMSAWRVWCRAAYGWLRRACEEKLEATGPPLVFVTLQKLMASAGVTFCEGQDMGEVTAAIDGATNAAVGGYGPGCRPGFINMSTSANGCWGQGSDPARVAFFVARAAGQPHLIRTSSGGPLAACCSGRFRFQLPDVTALNCWASGAWYKRDGVLRSPQEHYWRKWRCRMGHDEEDSSDDEGAPVVRTAVGRLGGAAATRGNIQLAAVLLSTPTVYFSCTKLVWAMLVHGGKLFHLGWGLNTMSLWRKVLSASATITFICGGYTVTFELNDVLSTISHRHAIRVLENDYRAKPHHIISHRTKTKPISSFKAVRKFYRWHYTKRIVKNKRTGKEAPQMTRAAMKKMEKNRGVMVWCLGKMVSPPTYQITKKHNKF